LEYSFQTIYLCIVDKKEQILKAAMKLLIENGMQATPMSAIAKEANAGMGTIYNYFPTKEDLVNAIYIYIKLDEIKAISMLSSGESIKKQFEHFYRAMVTYMVANPQHFRFMDQFNSSPVITNATRDEGANVFANYISILKKGQEQDIIKSISIDELLQFVNGGLMGFIRWIISTGKPLTPTLLDNQLRIAWDAIKE
jgi:AcrR family transcriptional regulator